ncbi:hypothetical protein RRG08_039185 [Elysia crispata]|uniref:Uncharacterized protein n=1 Tax=Elysia crispata TaxID=231223 RepID=A0AAE1DE56_9GAST|nr:hypothetical protein RRG08_039185 [Elysia crispata]
MLIARAMSTTHLLYSQSGENSLNLRNTQLPASSQVGSKNSWLVKIPGNLLRARMTSKSWSTRLATRVHQQSRKVSFAYLTFLVSSKKVNGCLFKILGALDALRTKEWNVESLLRWNDSTAVVSSKSPENRYPKDMVIGARKSSPAGSILQSPAACMALITSLHRAACPGYKRVIILQAVGHGEM